MSTKPSPERLDELASAPPPLPDASPETIAMRRLAPTTGGELRGLRRRFVLAITALVAVVLLAVAAALSFLSRSYFRDELERHATSYAELSVGPVADAFDTYFDSGFSKFREILLEAWERSPDLAGLAVYDTDVQPLFYTEDLVADRLSARPPVPRTPPPTTQSERFAAAVRGLELDAWAETTPDGERRFVVVAPYVEEWGRHRYSVAFFFSYVGLEAAVRTARVTVLGLSVLALGVGVGCAYLLASWSLGPVRRLTRGAARLAEGDLEHRIGLQTGDEFETLSRTLDVMADRLAENIRDLESSNDQLARLIQELQELDQVKGDLLANVSHELRTPLTAISGYVDALQEGLLGSLEPVQAESLAVVDRNIGRLRRMIDQLLSYSRMESGRLELELRPFELGPVAEHVVEALRAIHGRELDLRFESEPDLPEVYGDAGRVAQVIENLLTNAVKFSPAGSLIELSLREASAGVEVTVADRGIGIPEEARRKVFDRFYQVDATARRRYGGMGLGLAIVKEILDQHHSQIEVESREGQGTTFRFVLPAAAERTGVFVLPGHRRVVVIDDDAGFVQALAAHLSTRGFVVETAATATQGLSTLRRVRPDVVVVDRLLPDADGFDLVRDLRRMPGLSEVPVLVASVRAERALGVRAGADDYLVKPVTPAEVEARLVALLARGGGAGEE